MPSGRTHAAIGRRLLGTDGRAVQRLIDSTASVHGPMHRRDLIHTPQGVAVALALSQQLSGENIAHAGIHFATDQFFDEVGKMFPKGASRRMAKQLLEDLTCRALAGK